MKFGRQIKSVRRFANKALKKFSFGTKKVGQKMALIGNAAEKGGLATGNMEIAQAGQMLSEAGGLTGETSSVVEKLRTLKTDQDLETLVEEGIILADKGAKFGAKANTMVQ